MNRLAKTFAGGAMMIVGLGAGVAALDGLTGTVETHGNNPVQGSHSVEEDHYREEFIFGLLGSVALGVGGIAVISSPAEQRPEQPLPTEQA